MPGKNRKELQDEAELLATDFKYILHNNVTYYPADYETGARDVQDPERTIWIPHDIDSLQRTAKAQFGTIFHTPKETLSFGYMVEQHCQLVEEQATSLLIRTADGLRELRDDGQLYVPTGKFIPNTLGPMLNTDPVVKAEVLKIIENWLDSEEQAKALLSHLATTLAPHWSAIKYILLIGDGRNGKSVLMKMMEAVLGRENCSYVTRSLMAEKDVTIHSMNNRLLNLVQDGEATYLKDSGTEKTLVAGEVVMRRRFYESSPLPVQTNALFIEGLNQEPKSRDKSFALQKRIIRFAFPNTYPESQGFLDQMRSEKYTGAFLSLLIDHYVKKEEAGVRLAPTAESLEMQLEHEYSNSVAVQFLEEVEINDPLGSSVLLGMELKELTSLVLSWRVKSGDYTTWDETRVRDEFRPYLDIRRKSKRDPGQKVPYKVWHVKGFKGPGLTFIQSMRGADNDDTATVVAD
jgi:hypothetical protein